jgi:hypothetical protein
MGKESDARTPRVIGAGFGRTGTASLKRALEQIGFGPCHHMEEVVKNPAEVPTWEAAARGEKVDWATFMRGWGSTVDFPSSLYYRELMDVFPDAKVILTVRDAEGWYESMRTTIVPMLTRFPNRYVLRFLPFISGPPRVMAKTKLRATLMDRFDEKAHVLALFREHIEEVKRVVPAERLLVFEAKQGWKPLCDFLGAPVPDGDFPRVNDAKEFQRRTLAATTVSWIVLLLPFAVLASVLRWLL